MKILKYLFFLFLIAIIAGAIYIATKDGEYQIEETMIVNAPPTVVYNEVNNFTNWENWGPWRVTTNDIIVNYEDETQGEGAGFNWKSEEEGNGNITTTKAIPHQTLEQDIVYQPTFAQSTSKMYWNFEEVEEGTLITVGMTGSQSFKEKLAYTFNDNSFSNIMKPKLQASLKGLNQQILKNMSVYSISVDGVTTHGGGFYMYTTTSTKIDQIPIRMENMVTQVRNYMENNNITQQGSPLVLYNDWNEQNNTAIYSVGMFTPSLVITPQNSDVLNGMIPVQRVVKTTLKGDRDNLGEAWEAAYKYIEENSLQVDEDSAAFEIYKTESETILNPANHITEIYIPVLDVQIREMEIPIPEE